jgi:hypothetical protein
MIEQGIARENTKGNVVFKEGTYEYIRKLPCELARMVHGIDDHVIRKM